MFNDHLYYISLIHYVLIVLSCQICFFSYFLPPLDHVCSPRNNLTFYTLSEMFANTQTLHRPTHRSRQ